MKPVSSALFLTTLTCAALMADVSIVQAASLLDYLKGTVKQGEGSIIKPAMQKPDEKKQEIQTAAVDVSDPLPRVKGPDYFTYKPESLRSIDASKLGGLLERLVPASMVGSMIGFGQTTADAQPSAINGVKVRATDIVATALENFYSKNSAPIWVTEGTLNDRARAAIAQLAKVDLIGLDPLDYQVAEPVLADAQDDLQKKQQLASFEVQLSAAVLTYVLDNVRGRINPNKLSGYHDFTRKEVNLQGVMAIVASSPDVGAYLASRTPDSTLFRSLVAELARLRAMPDAQSQAIVIDQGVFLKPGGTSPELPNIIAAIRAKSSDKLKVDHASILTSYDGTTDYAPDIVDLVKAFQAENNLKPDGIIGKSSVRVLAGGDKTPEKIGKVIIALEQARWLPNDLGSRYVFINQPEFMAHYWQDNAEQFKMKVVVGGKNTQTYFFQDQIETVEFNPYWGVPRSIIINEMLPKLRQNPGYLDQNGYEVSIKGQTVSSSSIDWRQTNAVDVRQPPGQGNALGELKILFPNTHSIYMHDTPQKSFFSKDMRALSHGCVRLAEPRKMAAAVLGLTEADIASRIAGGKNKQASVTQPIPVYVSYFTAWPNKDGAVDYFDDVYERDTYTKRAFDAIKKSRQGSVSVEIVQ
ncbi:MAG: hypothetical protein RIR97_1361 [Pseudomonadota bacterium]